MNLLIAGCGSVGSALAMAMCKMGHTVSVVDRAKESFDKLDNNFTGFTVIGNPIDQDVLKRAGIEGCDAVAAVTSTDNVNVMISQVAKELFGVKQVLTRVYSPSSAGIFATFGLHIVCPTSLTVDSAIEALTGRQSVHYVDYGSKAMALSLEPFFENRRVSLGKGRVAIGVLDAQGDIKLIQSGRIPNLAQGDRIISAHLVESKGDI